MFHLTGRCIETGLRLVNDPQKRHFLEANVVREEFESTRKEIEGMLCKTRYFHGTGTRHYTANGRSKYDGTNEKAQDSLHSLLSEGLVPQEDIYNERLGTGAEKSVSLTKNRLYARLYAELFLPEKDRLDYRYGSRPFWWTMFLVRMAVKRAAEPPAKRNWGTLKEIRRREREKIRKWADSFRKDGRYRHNPLGLMMCGKSDIAENHPVIIGVGEGAFNPLPIRNSGFAAYETRSGETIPPASFTHVQVPLRHAENVRQKIASLGLRLPVIPMEFAELIDSEKRLWELLEYQSCPITQ